MRNLRNYKIAAFFFLFSLIPLASFAVEDGFGSARKAEGSYFSIYYSAQIDTAILSQQLNIQPSDEIIVGKTAKRKNSSEVLLSDMLDTLFLRVSDILDMHIYSFQGDIKICSSQAQLEQIYSRLFNKSLNNQRSFYVYSLNTIYISADSFKREILGHEMAHAIISRYFVVMPPLKIQEVLAAYVEYQLRKD